VADVRKKGERGVLYSMIDRECIGRPCFAPGMYQVRGATMSGSRATGEHRPTCMNRAYHGCPNDAERRYDPALRKKREADGWRNA
jgi:hypothetical protein